VRGTVTKRETVNGRPRWAYHFRAGKDENGKWIQKTRGGFETKGAAQDALADAMRECSETPVVIDRLIPTLAEFFERWHRDCAKREYSPKTAERFFELGQYAVRRFGNVLLDRLTTEQLAKDMNHLLDHGGRVTDDHPKGRPLAPKTVRHIAFLIQACLEQAVDWELISKNPMKKVKKPKVPRRRPKVVDRAGFVSLFTKAAGTRLYPAIVLAAATGMRRGELCALEWSDLDWDRATLEVSKSLEQTKEGLRVKGTKSDETRRFSIRGKALDVLRQHKREQDRERELYDADYANLNLIFCCPNGKQYVPGNFGMRVSKLMRRAGLSGITLHSLRHSHASQLLSDGTPITTVAARLGHASPNITLGIYSHALPADNEAAATLWNEAMGDVIERSQKTASRRMLANASAKTPDKKIIVLKSAG
jgi:integrase